MKRPVSEGPLEPPSSRTGQDQGWFYQFDGILARYLLKIKNSDYNRSNSIVVYESLVSQYAVSKDPDWGMFQNALGVIDTKCADVISYSSIMMGLAAALCIYVKGLEVNDANFLTSFAFIFSGLSVLVILVSSLVLLRTLYFLSFGDRRLWYNWRDKELHTTEQDDFFFRKDQFSEEEHTKPPKDFWQKMNYQIAYEVSLRVAVYRFGVRLSFAGTLLLCFAFIAALFS